MKKKLINCLWNFEFQKIQELIKLENENIKLKDEKQNFQIKTNPIEVEKENEKVQLKNY